MAVQYSYYTPDGSTRTFPSTKHIASKQHMAVWYRRISDAVWVVQNVSTYELINNTAVLVEAPDVALYDNIEIRVADTYDELTDSPSAIAIVAGLATEIVTLTTEPVVTYLATSGANATAAKLEAWNAMAERLTADSYATEASGVFVKIYTSNDDGTFTATPTTEYSALHYSTIASGDKVANTLDYVALQALDTSIVTKVNLTELHLGITGSGGVFWYNPLADKATANAGTIIDPSVSLALQGAGVGLGCWVRQYSGRVNVKWFGAVGDDATDDYPAIVLCSNVCNVTKEAIFFPKGNYVSSGQLIFSTEVIGDGKDSVFIRSTMANAVNPDTYTDYLIRMSGNKISNITIRGTGDNSQCGLMLFDGVAPIANNMNIYDFGMCALALGEGDITACYFGKINDVFIKREQYSASMPFIAGSRGLYVPDNGTFVANSNIISNTTVGGQYEIVLDMSGQSNHFLFGDVESLASTNILKMIRMRGEFCTAKGIYLEPRGTFSSTSQSFEFTSTSISCEIEVLSFLNPGNYTLDAITLDNGRKNSVSIVDRGANFQGYKPYDSGVNLYGNGDFSLWSTANLPSGMRYTTGANVTKGVGLGYTSTEDALVFTTTSDFAQVQAELENILGVPLKYLAGKEFSASCYVKIVSGDGMPQIDFGSATSYQIPSDGNWHLMTSTIKIDEAVATSPFFRIRSHYDGATATTSVIYFSRLMISDTRRPLVFSKKTAMNEDLLLQDHPSGYTSNSVEFPMINIGGCWLFVDTSGNLKIKTGTRPTALTDGVVVGTQV